MLYPRPAFIPDTGIFAQHHTLARYVDRTYLRPLMDILFTESLGFFVSKTYRHLPSGGIASGLAVVGKEHDIRIPQHAHIFDCRFVQFYHSFALLTMHCIISIAYMVPLLLLKQKTVPHSDSTAPPSLSKTETDWILRCSVRCQTVSL